MARFDSSVECEAIIQGGRILLKGSVTCTNVGNSDIIVDGRYCDVTVYSRRYREEARWREDYRPLFDHNPVVEPGETAEDSIWFETGAANQVAIEVEARYARNVNAGQIRKEIVILETSNSNDATTTVSVESAQRPENVLTKLREVFGW